VTQNIAVLHESFALKSLLPKLHQNNEKETRNDSNNNDTQLPIYIQYYISENNTEALNGGIHIVALHHKIR
jgi:hypothetical protein